jgi:alpha-methylacyl-CoA racemase
MSGPLAGMRVVELAGIGPTPHAAMLLADWGADVVRLVRPTAAGEPADALDDTQLRNRILIAANLKDPQQVAAVLDLIEHADVLTEGFRPRCYRTPRAGGARSRGAGPA